MNKTIGGIGILGIFLIAAFFSSGCIEPVVSEVEKIVYVDKIVEVEKTVYIDNYDEGYNNGWNDMVAEYNKDMLKRDAEYNKDMLKRDAEWKTIINERDNEWRKNVEEAVVKAYEVGYYDASYQTITDLASIAKLLVFI